MSDYPKKQERLVSADVSQTHYGYTGPMINQDDLRATLETVRGVHKRMDEETQRMFMGPKDGPDLALSVARNRQSIQELANALTWLMESLTEN